MIKLILHKMDVRNSRTCERCKTVVPLDQVRLYPKNSEENLLLCGNCTKELEDMARAKKLKSTTKPLPQADFAKYYCTRCSYAFRVDESLVGLTVQLKCPYCGKGERLERRGAISIKAKK